MLAIAEEIHDALEADLAPGDPKAIDFVENTRAELNAARAGIGRFL